MRYLFDFDHTLFCTERFKAEAEPYKESGEWVTPAIWDKLDAQSFFYDDTIEFLTQLEPKNVTLLTAWTRALGDEAYAFQEMKVKRSGVEKYVSDTIIMEGDKGPFVKELFDGRPTVFVDDRIDHLLSARDHCPEVQVVQMVREDAGILPGHPVVPVASTLAEVNAVLGI